MTADRLAYLHLLAVRDDRCRAGLGQRLCRWFDDPAVSTGADRAVLTRSLARA